MSVEFTDNSAKVKAALEDACIAFLYEAGGELETQVKRNTRVGTGQLKNSWKYKVNESKKETIVGSPLQNAIWEEFGTGEYALKGDGRKGYWVYVEDNDTGQSSTNKKQYTLQEAKEAVAYLRSKGLKAHYTKGKPPHRAFQNAFNSLKGALIKRAEQILKGRFK